MNYNLLKRFLDVVFSSVTLAILSPLFLIISAVLRLTGEGEVFYRQERMGFKNKKFLIYKFATMVKDSPNLGAKSLTLRNDPRVLPFGKILRISKINELPQFYNVLIGDMSIVGPRPQMEVDFLTYTKNVQSNIYKSKPGVTGIGSIYYRDEEKIISKTKNPRKFYKETISLYKGELEIWYLANKSFYVDIVLIFLTVLSVAFNKPDLIFKFFPTIPYPKKRV